jgi:hypothetical protein
MSIAARTVQRPASPATVLALQYAAPARVIVIPLGVLAAVVVVMSVITVAVVRAGGRPEDLDHNGAIVWSLFGFVVALGVQAVAVSFPLALAFGSTRRTFTVGTLATSLVESAMLTVAALVLLGLEVVTAGWFVGARVLRDSTLGGGDALALAAAVFLGGMTALALGGVFGASWVRLGSRGPALLGIALALVLAVGLIGFLPAIIDLASSFEVWWAAVAAVVIVAVSMVAQYLLLRRVR